jgi:predicted small metal-binding protein
MSADKTVRCDCGYEVRALDEAACVAAVRRHAREVHGVDLSVELARDVVRRAYGVPSSEHKLSGRTAKEK